MTKKGKIIEKVVEGLQEHIFPESIFPTSIKIETKYDDSRSVLIITFEEESK